MAAAFCGQTSRLEFAGGACIAAYSAGFAASARKPCSAATTCAPSPIAPPTRLTEPERTSPTANTPGTDVSSGGAGRPSPLPHCAPVTTKPPRSTLTPQPSSQLVAGSAPTNRNRLRMSKLCTRPAPAGCASAPARSDPSSLPSRPNHFGVEHQFDIRRRLDALDQIARHAGPEPAAADDHVDLARMAGQKHRGLPGGIAAADQHDILIRAQPAPRSAKPSTRRRGLRTPSRFSISGRR